MTPDSRPHLRIADYNYDLPTNRIAMRPLDERDASRLLVYRRATNSVEHRVFRDLPGLLPAHSLLVVNRSRVVAARLPLFKPTGGAAEVLLTRPVGPSADPAVVLASSDPSEWECLVGGRNVTPGMRLACAHDAVHVDVLGRKGTEGVVRISWPDTRSLSQVLSDVGHVPLPPYIKREDDAQDQHRYQTVFARDEGSVAAPTAGLHITDRVLQHLSGRGIGVAEVTLHVGLGTFQPVEADDARDHVMHAERIEIQADQLRHIVEHCRSSAPFVTVVGTTSLRTLESVYWFGCRLAAGEEPDSLDVDQWSAFDLSPLPREEALDHVLRWMNGKGLAKLWGETRLMLAPGAHLGVVDALVTNFHQPGNTLLLLVAAVAGDPQWRSVYQAALDSGYRFLSYGDSSLILR